MKSLLNYFEELLCKLGIHDFRVIDRSFQFGASGGIEKVKCRRCGIILNRKC